MERSFSFLNKESLANLAGDFEKVSPDGLTAIFEIGFSNANIQRLNLEFRMDDIHNGSNGFNSNMKVNGATANLENKPDVDGKSAKGVVEPILQPGPENRRGVWVTGFGDFVNVDGDGNANGYDFTTGGFSLGIDYRISDQLAIGAMGEYAHTWTALQPSGDIDADSGRGGLYATWFNHGLYLNGAIYGGHSTYESSRSSLGGLATGGTEGAECGARLLAGGYDSHFGSRPIRKSNTTAAPGRLYCQRHASWFLPCVRSDCTSTGVHRFGYSLRLATLEREGNGWP